MGSIPVLIFFFKNLKLLLDKKIIMEGIKIMSEIKIAEINITNILIVIFVGIGGILSIFYSFEQGMALCFGGLVGYMGRYVQESTKHIEVSSDEDCDEGDGA